MFQSNGRPSGVALPVMIAEVQALDSCNGIKINAAITAINILFISILIYFF